VNEIKGNSHLDDQKSFEAANFFKENILKKGIRPCAEHATSLSVHKVREPFTSEKKVPCYLTEFS